MISGFWIASTDTYFKEKPGVFVDGVLYTDYNQIARIPVNEMNISAYCLKFIIIVILYLEASLICIQKNLILALFNFSPI